MFKVRMNTGRWDKMEQEQGPDQTACATPHEQFRFLVLSLGPMEGLWAGE